MRSCNSGCCHCVRADAWQQTSTAPHSCVCVLVCAPAASERARQWMTGREPKCNFQPVGDEASKPKAAVFVCRGMHVDASDARVSGTKSCMQASTTRSAVVGICAWVEKCIPPLVGNGGEGLARMHAEKDSLTLLDCGFFAVSVPPRGARCTLPVSNRDACGKASRVTQGPSGTSSPSECSEATARFHLHCWDEPTETTHLSTRALTGPSSIQSW
jgi:hypothetical protein